MIIIGIDPGFATVGYGVLEKRPGGSLAMLDYGVITTPKEKAFPERLVIIKEGLEALIDKFSPDAVAVEELFFNTNITTGINVAHARGVILLTAQVLGIPLFEYTPLEVKQTLTGVGRADKKQMEYMVQSILHLRAAPRPDDAADALSVAICHANTNQTLRAHSSRIDTSVYRKPGK